MVMLNNNQKEKLDEIINYIVNSREYRDCITMKEQMKNNQKVTNLVKEVKKIQKQYIKSNYQEDIKIELEEKKEELNLIPIYKEYNLNLIKVNRMINLVKEELNDYFYKKLNKDIDI